MRNGEAGYGQHASAVVKEHPVAVVAIDGESRLARPIDCQIIEVRFNLPIKQGDRAATELCEVDRVAADGSTDNAAQGPRSAVIGTACDGQRVAAISAQVTLLLMAGDSRCVSQSAYGQRCRQTACERSTADRYGALLGHLKISCIGIVGAD